MIQVELEPELEAEVRQRALEWDASESALVKQIVLQWLEDREDYDRAVRSLLSTTRTFSQEEMQALSDAQD